MPAARRIERASSEGQGLQVRVVDFRSGQIVGSVIAADNQHFAIGEHGSGVVYPRGEVISGPD